MTTLETLYQILESRKAASPASSYTARLLDAGEDEIVKKIGEEAIEVLLAAKSQGEKRLIEEISDLTYHVLVLMVAKNISLEDIAKELNSRQK